MLRKFLSLILIAALAAAFSTPAPAFAARLKICQANSTGTLFVSGNCGKRAARITNIASLKGEDGRTVPMAPTAQAFMSFCPAGRPLPGWSAAILRLSIQMETGAHTTPSQRRLEES